MEIRVTVKTPGIEKMRKALDNRKFTNEVLRDWSLIFRTWIRARFYRLSRGLGEWPGLALSTLRRRRGGGVNAAILRDTGALFAATQPNAVGGGSILQDTKPKRLGFSIMLGGGGELARIASYHQEGNARLPARKILVPPDEKLRKRMADRAKLLLKRWLNGGR